MNVSRNRWIKPGCSCASVSRKSLLFFVGLYRTVGTPIFGGNCRFEPSCSEYAVEALHVHSPLKAVWLIIKRLSKCRPLGPYGIDPVPRPQMEKLNT